MTLNLYDLLDVEESADAAEIRAAWKAAIAELNPTDRLFRAYNDAAGVLLDTDKRAAYDAELAEARAETDVQADQAETVADAPLVTAGAATPETAESTEDDVDEVAGGSAPEVDLVPDEAPVDGSGGARAMTGPPGWAIGAAAVAAVLSLALAAWILTMPGVRADAADSPARVAERGALQQRAAVEAEAAAEKLVGPVLSYNHETMAADLERIRGNMTAKMGEKQAASWPEITKEAEAQEIVVEATPAGTALIRVSPKGDRATVVAFVDQFVEKKGAQPFVLRMWATMSLVEASGGEGRWLLDDICTDDTCG